MPCARARLSLPACHMPKPKSTAKEKRRAARDIANRLALAALNDLIDNPPITFPDDDALRAYRDQLRHYTARPRALSSPAAGENAPGANGPSGQPN